MFVVAQDLKVQVEFNPATVAEYRLLGYDNRRLDKEEFDDDAKDAGDVGAGHEVTAFYELIPARGGSRDDDLDYQRVDEGQSSDFLTVHVRYKHPGETTSTEVAFPARAGAYTTRPTTDFRFASAVVEFALAQTRSPHAEGADVARARIRAEEALGDDRYGLRAEFVGLIDTYMEIGY
jgi:Ca-activated chloride channel family protein